MTINIYEAAAILLLHFVGDFIIQTQWQAANKSTRRDALGWHVFTYILPMLLLLAFSPPLEAFGSWLVCNAGAHLFTDSLTSRRTSANWNNGKPAKAFWVWLGADQLIHAVTLLGTWAAIT